jgi:hypothetical protein
MEKQTDNTKFIIGRFDTYISQANVKGNFLLAFNTFLIGGILTNYSKITLFIKCPSLLIILNIILTIMFILSIVTAFFVIKAVYPFLHSSNSSKEKYHSHIFFNSVSEFKDGNEYFDSLKNHTEEQFDSDLANQAYLLAKGLKKKYKYLQLAMIFVYIEMILMLGVLLIIIF